MNIALFYLMHIYCICLVNCDASYAGQNKKNKVIHFQYRYIIHNYIVQM